MEELGLVDESLPRSGDASTLSPGERVGSYRIERLLAEGGMGKVYVAAHTVLPRRAALKVLRAELLPCAHAHEGLLQEARVLESLADPTVARVYDAGVLDDGRPWMAMELIEGICLAELIKSGVALPVVQAARIVRATADALMPAHLRGVVHSDVKPENVMVCGSGDAVTVKLVDWGIARRATRKQEAAVASGTPPYMSPEQIRGEPLDERTDLYALGVVAYELLTGKIPFAGCDTGSIFLDHLEARPRMLRELRPDVPAALDALVLALLAKSPEDRPSLDMVRAITAAVTEDDKDGVLEIDYTQDLEDPVPPTDEVLETPCRPRWTPPLAGLPARDALEADRRASTTSSFASGSIAVPRGDRSG